MDMRSQKIIDIITGQSTQPLDSELEIEDLIVAIGDIDKKTDFLERLKKHRTQKVQNEIDKLTERKELLKEVIQKTLTNFKHKSLNFPGIGRVSNKEGKSKWVVENEEELIKALANELDPKDFAKIVTSQTVLQKRELNSVLDDLDKVGKLPSCVKKEKAPASLTVSFGEDIDSKVQSLNDTLESRESQPRVDKPTDSNSSPDFDKIDF